LSSSNANSKTYITYNGEDKKPIVSLSDLKKEVEIQRNKEIHDNNVIFNRNLDLTVSFVKECVDEGYLDNKEINEYEIISNLLRKKTRNNQCNYELDPLPKITRKGIPQDVLEQVGSLDPGLNIIDTPDFEVEPLPKIIGSGTAEEVAQQVSSLDLELTIHETPSFEVEPLPNYIYTTALIHSEHYSESKKFELCEQRKTELLNHQIRESDNTPKVVIIAPVNSKGKNNHLWEDAFKAFGVIAGKRAYLSRAKDMMNRDKIALSAFLNQFWYDPNDIDTMAFVAHKFHKKKGFFSIVGEEDWLIFKAQWTKFKNAGYEVSTIAVEKSSTLISLEEYFKLASHTSKEDNQLESMSSSKVVAGDDRLSTEALNFFDAFCLATNADFDRIKELIEPMNYRKLPTEYADAMSVKDSTNNELYLVEKINDEKIILLAFSQPNACSVNVQGVDFLPIKKEMIEQFKLVHVATKDIGMQMYEVYVLSGSIGGKREIAEFGAITVTYSKPEMGFLAATMQYLPPEQAKRFFNITN